MECAVGLNRSDIFSILNLNNFPNNLPDTLPAALLATRLPTVPFCTDKTSPKNLPSPYRIPLVWLIALFFLRAMKLTSPLTLLIHRINCFFHRKTISNLGNFITFSILAYFHSWVKNTFFIYH